MPRRFWLDWLICLIVLMAAYAGRGWLLAHLLQGRYPWSDLVFDVLALALLVCVFRLLDLGLRVAFQRRFAPEQRRWRLLADAVRFVIVFAVAAPFLVVLSQLHPQRIACAVHPADLGLPCEEVTLESDVKLSAWSLPVAGESDRPVVLIVHGVGANKQNFLGLARGLHERGFPVFLLDLRAHGDSEGRLSSLGVREADDVAAAIHWLHRRYPERRLYGMGYSLGAAALLQAAGLDVLCDGYVLDSAFARLENSARHSMSSYYFPAPLIGPWWHASRFWANILIGIELDEIQPERHIERVRGCPLLFIHGVEDATTPCSDSVRLHELAGPAAELWLVEGAGHLQAVAHPDYINRLERFLVD